MTRVGRNWTQGAAILHFIEYPKKAKAGIGSRSSSGQLTWKPKKSGWKKVGMKMSDVVEFGEIELCDGQDPDGNWFQISSRGT